MEPQGAASGVVAEEHVELLAPKKESAPQKSSWIRSYLCAGAIYLLITLLMFFPATLNITNTAIGGGSDVYESLWGLWWVPHAIFALHTNIFYTGLLYWPVGSSLLFETMAPLIGFFSAPLQIVSLVFAYNIAFILGFVVSGVAMMLLADYLVKEPRAAFIAGLAFAFSSVHIALAISHVAWFFLGFVPLSIYFLLRMLEENEKYISAAGLAISFVLLAFAGTLEASLILTIALLLLLIYYLISAEKRSRVLNSNFMKALALAIALTLIAGSWGFIPIIRSYFGGGGVQLSYLNDIQHNEIWSDDLLSFFIPSYYNGIFGSLSAIYTIDPSEGSAYIGFTILLLALYAAYKQFKITKMWLALTCIFLLLALGPYMQIATRTTPMPSLYLLLHYLPLLGLVREPGRFDIVAAVGIAVLAAYGAKLLFEELEKKKASFAKKRYLLPALVTLLFLIESNGAPLTSALVAQSVTTPSVPLIYKSIGMMQGNFSVLELPAEPLQFTNGPHLYIGMATYYTAITQKPLVGGLVTRTNTTQQIVLLNVPLIVEDSNLENYGTFAYQSPISENYTNQTLFSLASYGTGFIIVHKDAYNQSSLAQLSGYLTRVFGREFYNDSAVAAWSTFGALSNYSANLTYTAFPVPGEWEQGAVQLNGTSVLLWMPAGVGGVLLFAPSANPTAAQEVNTTIRLNAISQYPSRLYVAEQNMEGNPALLATLNTSTSIKNYTLQLQLQAGGNSLFFLQGSNQTPVYVANVSFSRS